VGAALATADPELPARRLLDELDIPAGAREALLARVEISSANSADVVAARDLGGLAHVDDAPAPSIAGGNQRLPLALAGELGAAVRLSAPVERVAWSANGVRMAAAGAELEADACVIAVPVAVLDRIEFDPPLPEAAGRALAGVRCGHAAKLFVPLRAPAPPSAVMAVPERYWSWTATGAGKATQPVVSCFAGSQRALAALGVSGGPERWLDSLARLRPELELDRAGAVLSTWADDPWARAAYSTSPARELADTFARPIGPLAFAGEHLGGEFAALMEGAIRSGRRAAAQLAPS
jgi:monoamine oxidase